MVSVLAFGVALSAPSVAAAQTDGPPAPEAVTAFSHDVRQSPLCRPITLGPTSAPSIESTADALGPALLAPLLDRILPPDRDLPQGSAIDALVQDALQSLCGRGDVAAWSPRVCMAPGGPRSLRELRSALVNDLVHAPALVAGRLQVDDAVRGELQRLSVVVSALLATDPVGEAFRGAFGPELVDRICTATPSPAPAPAPWPLREALARALLEVLADDPRLEHIEVDAARLAPGLLPSWPGDHPQLEPCVAGLSAILTALQQALRAQAELVRVIDAARAASAVEALATFVTVLESLDTQDARALPLTELRVLAAAIVAGDGAGLVDALVTSVAAVAGHRVQLPASEELRVFFDVLQARTAEGRRRLLRALALGDWSRPWDATIDIGAAWVSGGHYDLGADFSLGYTESAWGLRASGTTLAYDLSTGGGLEAATGLGGGLEGWWRSGRDGLTLDLRLAAAGSNLDSILSSTSSGARVTAWTNDIGQGSALVGITWQGERTNLGAWLGGSVQYESYDPLVVTTVVSIQEQQNLTFAEQGRVHASVDLVPGLLFGRLRADAVAHQITHTTATLLVGGGGGASRSLAASTDEEIDARLRAFLGVTLLSFLGIVPGVTGGFDYVARSGSPASVTPFLGIGLDGDSQ